MLRVLTGPTQMHILLTGADGFIGSALVEALAARSHALTLCVRDVAAASRRWPRHRVIAADFVIDDRAESWVGRLAGVDAVINAVGIFRERGAQTFAAVHTRAPVALFQACAAMGVKRVVQVSALGAAPDAVSAFLRSKFAADAALQTLPVMSTVVRPSLVFAGEGASARLFLTLAGSPATPLPGGGGQCLQPIHRDDLVAAVASLLEMPQPPPVLEAVGPTPLRLREYLAILRRGLGLGRPRFIPVPRFLVRMAARFGRFLPGGLLNPSALDMLERGSCAEADDIVHVLGRAPRPASEFIDASEGAALRMQAQLRGFLPLLRFSVALVWIVTGVVSLGLYPVADSLALLARVGITGTTAIFALYGAALLDLTLGIATLAFRRRRWLYRAQMVVILAYTVVITIWLPEYWLHPYGPVLKNLPLLAVLWLLHDMEERTR